jgi:hypothetical protein
MEKKYDYIEETQKKEISVVKNTEPKVILKNIHSLNRKTNEKIEVSIFKKLFLERSVFSKKGFKRLLRISDNNSKISEIKNGTFIATAFVSLVSFISFALSNINFESSPQEEIPEHSVGLHAAQLTETLNSATALFGLIIPVMGMAFLFMGLISIKRYAEDPRSNPLMKGIIFLMAGSMMVGSGMLMNMPAQGGL